jgi:hypothetical protein
MVTESNRLAALRIYSRTILVRRSGARLRRMTYLPDQDGPAIFFRTKMVGLDFSGPRWSGYVAQLSPPGAVAAIAQAAGQAGDARVAIVDCHLPRFFDQYRISGGGHDRHSQ